MDTHKVVDMIESREFFDVARACAAGDTRLRTQDEELTRKSSDMLCRVTGR
jgi:hypothetical protein